MRPRRRALRAAVAFAMALWRPKPLKAQNWPQQLDVDPPAVWPDSVSGNGFDDFVAYRALIADLDRFNRQLAGCPSGATDANQCAAGAGTFDLALWRKLRGQAARVFNLELRP